MQTNPANEQNKNSGISEVSTDNTLNVSLQGAAMKKTPLLCTTENAISLKRRKSCK